MSYRVNTRRPPHLRKRKIEKRAPFGRTLRHKVRPGRVLTLHATKGWRDMNEARILAGGAA